MAKLYSRCALHNAHFGPCMFIKTTSTVVLLGDCTLKPITLWNQPVKLHVDRVVSHD
jgi:hypothetical protein